MFRYLLPWVFAAGLLVGGAGSTPAFASSPSAGYALENGDVNGDFARDLNDVILLLKHLFHFGPPPVPLALCGTGEPLVRNGDTNGDARVDISDAIFTLNGLFNGGPLASCEDAMDSNDDGAVDISDAVKLLGYLFLGQAVPPSPFPNCGPDAAGDALVCSSHGGCG